MSDFMSMSDADFMAQGASKLAEMQAEPVVGAEANASEVSTAAEVAEPVAEPVTEEGHQETEETAEGAEVAEAETAVHSAIETPEAVEPGNALVTAEPVVETAVTMPEGAERIFQTFRANGRDMQVKNVDEAIRLMQMGANYSQKRAVDKKNLGYVKVLEQNNLLDHDKLSFAVDLLAGKPEAIGKLLKDTQIDVHELDDDKVAAYRAESRAPSEAALDLDSVVSEIESSKHFGRLVTEMKTWDEKSQALLGNHPQSLKQLTEQMESGVYDKVMDEVNRQNVLGNLNGIPLMQAYNEIGQEMAKSGAFNAPEPAPKGPVTKLVTPGKKPSPANPAVEDRRRAAAPSKGVTTATTETTNPKFLTMSDEEFLKHTKR